MKAIKSTKMKKMFAVRHVIIDREDPEDSTIKIIGVYLSKNNAQKVCDEARKNFLLNINDDIDVAKQQLYDDDDRIYSWNVIPVCVETGH